MKATTVECGEVVAIEDIPQEEFCYFRFVLKEKEQSNFLSFRVTPRNNAAGTASDPDLYVSNKYAGLVAVDRDNFIWRSTNVGPEQVNRSGYFHIL